jgi:hypothetical protein
METKQTMHLRTTKLMKMRRIGVKSGSQARYLKGEAIWLLSSTEESKIFFEFYVKVLRSWGP